MAIVLTDETALAFWRKHRITQSSLYATKPCRMDRIPSGVPSAADVRAACEGFTEPDDELHILVAGKDGFRHNEQIRYHSISKKIPRGSIHKISDSCYVASPEFTAMRLAQGMGIVEHVELIYELAGTYALNTGDLRGFSQTSPLLSVNSLSKFLERASGLRGAVRTSGNLRHSSDGAASPMEAQLAMVLTFPRRLGGYGLPKPRLNYAISLKGPQGSKITRHAITVDFAWPKHRVALEYDSDMFHTGAEKIAEDSERRNDLGLLGWSTHTVTRKEMASISKMDKIAASLVRRLGAKARKPADGFYEKQASLKRELLRLRHSDRH